MSSAKLIPDFWEVPEVFRRRLGDGAGRQRLMEADGHLLLILHAPPGPGEFERTGRLFWRHPDGQWDSTEPGNGKEALRRHIEEFRTIVSELEKDEAAASSAHDYFELTQHIGPLHRTVRHMAAVFQDARQALPNERELINLRDQTYEVDRGTELLYNNAKHVLDFAIAKRSEEQATAAHSMAVAAHRLNMLAGFFFPIATLTAIFGTSLKTGLEEYNPPLPFLAVLLIGVVMGIFLTLFLKRTGSQKTT